jgi:hypothetical protein
MWPFSKQKNVQIEETGTITRPIHGNVPFVPSPFPSPTTTATQEEMLNEMIQKIAETPMSEHEQTWADEACLRRFLRATKWQSVPAAIARFNATLEWRRQVKPSEINPNDIQEEAQTGKILLQGFDKHGRPVIFLRPRFENTKASPRQLLLLTYTMEQALKQNPDCEQLVIIIDMLGSTWSNTPGLSQTKNTLTLLERHYCERLAWGAFVNPIGILPVFWSLVSPLVDPVTKAKVFFNDPKKDQGGSGGPWINLNQMIPKECLMVDYGGSFDYKFDFQEYWTSLTRL